MRVVMLDDPQSSLGALLGVGDTRRGVPRELRCPEKSLMSPAGKHTVSESRLPATFRQPFAGSAASRAGMLTVGRGPRAGANTRCPSGQSHHQEKTAEIFKNWFFFIPKWYFFRP